MARRRFAWSAISLLFAVSVCVPGLFSGAGFAQDGIDHGQTGTLNLDYFNPKNDGHMRWLINDIETNHLKPAIRAFGEGNWQRMTVELDYILARLVNHPQALTLAGVAARMTKNSVWAIRHYERAIRLYSQYALTHAQYGKYLVDIGRFDLGIGKLKHAIEMNSKLAAAYAWLAMAYAKSGDAERAREVAEHAKSLGFGTQLSQYGYKE